jgi:protein ImuB
MFAFPPGLMPPCRTALTLWLPAFELRLELVRTPELDSTSVALLAPGEPGGRHVVDQVSERAGGAGVRRGMLVSQAVALCPGLTLLEPDPAHYAAASEQVIEALAGITPILEPEAPGLVHLGVDGLERLLGSPPAQVRHVLRALLEVLPPPLVAALRVGRAPGTFGARVAAAAARPGAPVLVPPEVPGALARFLHGQPAAALPLDPGGLDLLERLGVRTLGAVAALPEAALVRHFGGVGREIRALARGERIDPVRPLHRPRPIRAVLDLPAPVGERAALHRALDRLLDRLLARPERRDRAVRRLRAGGQVEGGGSWEVEVTLREPSARRERLAFPLRSRVELRPPPRALESLFVEAVDFGAPVTQVSLFERSEAGARSRAGDPPGAGGGASPLPPALRSAVRELELRIGGSPLYRVVEVDPWSRLPERRYALLPVEA